MNYVGVNQFAMKPEETLAQYEHIQEECLKEAGGVYVGAGLRKYKEPVPIYEVKKQVERPPSAEKEEAVPVKKGSVAKKGGKKEAAKEEPVPVEEEREIVGYMERAALYKGNAVQYGLGLLRVV